MRHKQPEIVTIYYNAIKAGPPKCCHSCEMYGTDGLCVEFFKEPPEETFNRLFEYNVFVLKVWENGTI